MSGGASKQSGFVRLRVERGPDTAARSLRSLRLYMGASALVALALFAAFAGYRQQQLEREALVRLQNTLTIAHEHALRVLDTNEALLRYAAALVRDDSDARIREQRPALHAQLREMADRKPHVQFIRVRAADGTALMDSLEAAPAAADASERDFFAWHRDKRGGVYVGALRREPQGPSFNISRGRYRAGAFAGVVSVGLDADYFQQFHSQLAADDAGLAITLFRGDGVVFARWPELQRQPERMSPQGELLSRVLAGQDSGTIRSVSSLDRQERLMLYRRLGDYPVYIGVGRDLGALQSQWLAELGRVAGFVVVPVLLLVLAAYVAMRRTREALDAARRLQEESTARRQVEEALVQAQKMEALGRLTGGVAHDFNNALMVIAGNLHLLRRTQPDAPAKHLDAIGRAVDSATKLTRQLLAFSRRQPLAPEVVALQERLPALRDLLSPILGSRVRLEIEVDARTPPVRVDPAELELALINLAVNAKDAMPEGGTFAVRAGAREQAGDWRVWIEASDTGTGMPQEVAARAFDPFFTTKAIGSGTGLGLGQVQALCRRAGGEATLASAPGQGTRVTLEFPASAQDPAPTPPGERPQAAIRQSVLLVEDNPEVAAVVVPVLEGMGCTVVHRDSAEAALAWLEQPGRTVDLLLTDVVMPGRSDGIALVKAVQQRWPALRVLVMTGYAEQIDAITRMGYEVLAKPFSPRGLAEAIDRVLKSRAGEVPADG